MITDQIVWSKEGERRRHGSASTVASAGVS